MEKKLMIVTYEQVKAALREHKGVQISEAQKDAWLKHCVQYFEEYPTEDCVSMISGDTLVFAERGEHAVCIYVTKILQCSWVYSELFEE